MKNHKTLILALAFGMLMLALAACSGASSEAPTFPTGRFVSRVNPQALYQFNEDKTWTFISNSVVAARGTYEVEGNLWIEQGTTQCPYTGTYEWTFDGTNLSFKLVGEDACDPRRSNTDGKTFIIEQSN